MATRVVEWKKPYTWGKAIEIDENKVISLRLRDENNLIIYDEWDNEIYVDLQLPAWMKPLDAFPVWITTGRVLVADDWDKTGTIISAETTSWDNIKLLYADDGTLYINNGWNAFKQIYFKWDVDAITNALQTQIDALSGLGRFLSLWDWETWEPISFPLSTPYTYHTWDWYMINVVDNTTNYRPKWSVWVDDDPSETREVETEATEIWDVYIYDWSTWLLQKNWWWWGSAVLFSQLLGSPYDNTNLGTALNSKQDELTAWTGITIQNNVISSTSIEYKTQAEYTALLPWAASDGKHYFIYTPSVVPPTPWRQPWPNTLAYYTLDNDGTNQSTATTKFSDVTLNTATYSTTKAHGTNTYSLYCDGSTYAYIPASALHDFGTNDFTISCWVYSETNSWQYPWFISNAVAAFPDHWDWAYRISDRFNNINQYNFCWDWYNNFQNVPTSISIKDGWHNCVVTRISWIFYIYLDGNQEWTITERTTYWCWVNTNIYLWYNMIDNLYSTAYLNDIIFESVGWSAQDVSDYYQATA